MLDISKNATKMANYTLEDITEDVIKAIENEVGWRQSGWDLIDSREIIAACMNRALNDSSLRIKEAKYSIPTEVMQIIRAGLIGDTDRVHLYAKQWHNNLERSGDKQNAERLRRELTGESGQSATLDTP